jgi:hypothetical protein
MSRCHLLVRGHRRFVSLSRGFCKFVHLWTGCETTGDTIVCLIA